MSKTLELLHERVDGDAQYEVYSPDHEESFRVEGYTLDIGDRELLMEAGRQTVNIEPDEYYHIEESDSHSHVTISVEDEPPAPTMVEIPYRDAYTTSEKVAECGIPDTQQSREEFYYCPEVMLIMSYHDGDSEVEGVKINGTEYELVEQ